MKRLPPAKRNQLIAVVIAALGLVGAIYFLLIEPQYDKNKQIARDTVAARVELQKTKELISKRDVTAIALSQVMLQLAHAEEDIAVGDIYSWTFDTIRQFKAKYPLDIPSVGQPSIGVVDVIGDMPYKQVKVVVAGSGYYHDIGKFITDFENNFPHIRVANLILDPIAASPGTTMEKLNFRMEIVALVKPNN